MNTGLEPMPLSSHSLEKGSAPGRPTVSQICEIAWAFLRQGAVSFGGPTAHLGYLRAEFVTKRNWLDDVRYGELVALCQFLPGPASSQVVFALGMLKAGIVGALTASFCFTLPAACLMIGFAYGAAWMGDWATAGWLHGLKLAAVAVVAQAVWGMGKRLCTDRVRISICVASAGVVLLLAGAIYQLAVIALGGLLGVVLYRRAAPETLPLREPTRSASHRWALGALGLCAFLLATLPVLALTTNSRSIDLFDSFYRSGSLVFGGGHVLLPLLRNEVIPSGWLTDDQFLVGYGAIQAFPGPMFAFSAYVGTAIGTGDGLPNWRTGVLCLFAIFLPAWLLIGGALPFWDRLRTKAWAQASLAGANAAVVGVLLAALYEPVFKESVHGSPDLVTVFVGFVLLEHWKVSPLLVVIGAAGVGQLTA